MNKVRTKSIQRAVAKMFRGYDREFVNELARLLILYGNDFKIDTDVRVAMFLAHVKAEVDVTRKGRVKMRESMNYSSKRLKQVFKRFRKNPALATKYGRNRSHGANQEMIANIAYHDRLGNGNLSSGDGWRYRGWGVLQTTGKRNFLKDVSTIEQVTGIVLKPLIDYDFMGWADSYTFGVLAGMANWKNSKMYKAKDMDASTRIINRYTDSYRKRRRLYAQAYNLVAV